MSNEKLKTELERLYHNATLRGKLFTESDYESDLYQSYLDDYVQMEFSDIKYNVPNILKYGKVYSYGRGGRTVAPENLIKSRGGSSFSIKSVEDLEDSFNLEELTKDLKKFNDYVTSWCNSTPDSIIKMIREEHSEKLEMNKDKKRKTRTVTTYE